MRRSSDSVGALAAALAKAQAELTNPEKSLIAILPAERGQQPRSFRYAPLSVGLDIVRKTLGRHEIATIQATGVDRDNGTIQLTTTLAHASGEWIASDWPVCALTDLPAPHRMGAALTYARRYALFTLVGIAGEDDVDAPDLPTQSKPAVPAQSSYRTTSSHGKNARWRPIQQHAILDQEASAEQRNRLMAELESITSFDDAADWAKRTLPVKNTLIAEHACDIEAALQTTLARLPSFREARHASGSSITANQDQSSTDAKNLVTVDRNALVIGRTPRRRNKAHLKFVASQPCLLCGRCPSDPHHLRFAQFPALGRKTSDEFTVPLCRTHHRQIHRFGREAEWWQANKPDIDPLKIAKELWDQTRDGPHSVQTLSAPGG